MLMARLAGGLGLLGGSACAVQTSSGPWNPGDPVHAGEIVIQTPGVERPPFEFSDSDERFLDEVQYGAFRFFVEAVDPDTGLVCDRTSNPTLVSVAGVGFQLSALTIGVDRGWISRDEAEALALRIVRSLADEPGNRVHGLFFHFLDSRTAKPHPTAYEHVVSTIDSALLFAGLLTASEYFGGEVAEIADALVGEADWSFFLAPEDEHPAYRGYVSLGWRSADKTNPTAGGALLDYYWSDATDEQRLVTFLGQTPTDGARRLPPEAYYQLRRRLGTYADLGLMVFSPYSGALFTSFFSHCWIDYAHLEPDDPAAFGFGQRARVDWWENSRRHVNLHRVKALENPLGLRTPGEHAWGLSASDGDGAYLVSMLYPEAVEMVGARHDWDIQPPDHGWRDQWHSGLLAPYAAGSAIMFEPEAAVSALRFYRGLQGADGDPLIWRHPAGSPSDPTRYERGRYDGNFGFLDSYTLDTESGEAWVAHDYVAIDQGPLILAIENARTGRVWERFMSHPLIERAAERLRLERVREP